MTRVLRFRVEKLIRDGMPAIMRDLGLAVFEHRLGDDEFISQLKDKLVEEAAEARAATCSSDLLDELADLTEVIMALTCAAGLTAEAVEAHRLAKRRERGGFDARVFNAAVAAPEGLPAAGYYLARPEQYPLV